MLTYRNFLLGLLAICCYSCSEPTPDFDLLIQGGEVYLGTEQNPTSVDIGIQGERITYIGDATTARKTAVRTIDATGYVVCPGFIDSHTHALSDLTDSTKSANLNYLLQGVTTVVTGSDGNSVNDVAGRLAQWEAQGVGTNAAIMVGHRNIRRTVMGMAERAPTEEELANMSQLVESGMQAGALGFSSGLYYSPASFSETEEVIALAKISAQYGGLYDAHIRDESTYNIGLMAAILESLEIGEKANIPVNISHIKCLGVDVWGMSEAIIDTINAARASGLKVTADQYPYLASGTHLSNALLPKWVFADMDDYRPKFSDPTLLPKIRGGIIENIRRRGGANSLLLVLSKVPNIEGKTLADLTEEWDTEPVDAVLRILKEGDAAVASFNMNEKDVHLFMQQPWVLTCSDGTSAHPRKFGSFPKKIRQFVREQHVLSLGQMITQSTHLTAETFGIPERGALQEGYYADVLIFKPEEVQDNATFREPSLLSSGIPYIVLNGKIAVDAGTVMHADAGQVIRKGQ